MGVKLRRTRGKWYLFIDYKGRRKCKCVGTDKRAAEEVRRQIEAKLVVGDLSFVDEKSECSFQEYSERWMKQYAEIELKRSSIIKHEQVLRLYLLPRFGRKPLKAIRREEIKAFLAELVSKGSLARRTVCV